MKLTAVRKQLFECLSLIVSKSQDFIHDPTTSFCRTSPLDLNTMLYAILAMGGASLSKELLRLDIPVSNSAFVQRRYHIKSQAFYQLFKEFTAKIPLSDSLPILAVDGSDVCIPRNRDDLGTYFKTGLESRPYHLIHINAFYDITNRIYQDLSVQDKRDTDERSAFINMMANSPFKQALVIMDRGYESYNVMAHCEEKGWFYILRVRDGRNSIKSKLILPDTPCFDERIQLNLCRKQTMEMRQKYDTYPNQFRFLPANAIFDFLPKYNRKKEPTQSYRLDFRIIRIEIAPGKYETLVTNTDYSPSKLKRLYASRWGIETLFRDLKYSLGLVNFHAKKKEGILQEIFAHVINFNFCQWLTSLIDIHMANRQYDYQICFSDASYACLSFLRGNITSFRLETFIAKHLSIIRPDRHFPRKIKVQGAVGFTYRVS